MEPKNNSNLGTMKKYNLPIETSQWLTFSVHLWSLEQQLDIQEEESPSNPSTMLKMLAQVETEWLASSPILLSGVHLAGIYKILCLFGEGSLK